MVKVTLNQLLEMLQGGIGDLVFRQMPDGTIIISGTPRHNKRKTTKKQKAHRERFREAAKHAKWAARKYPIYAELAKGTWRFPYNFALSDWFNPPVIHRIKRQKGHILVEATDNIMVAKVRVTILDGEGKVIEKGEGTKRKGNWWEFVPKMDGRSILAEAWDLAENVTKFVLE
jgi:hypothetical protein